MGDPDRTAPSLSFNGSIHLVGTDEGLSSEGGALMLRHLDERLGMSRWLEDHLEDPRHPVFITYSQAELIRTRVLLMAQGWIDQDDADRHRFDSALRLAVSDRAGQHALESDRHLPSQPTLCRLTETLARGPNRSTFRASLLETSEAKRLAARGRLPCVTLDIDSTDIRAHGHQAGVVFNGYYKANCLHPHLVWIDETNEILDVQIRDGNAHTAAGADKMLLPLIGRVVAGIADRVFVRADAGYPSPDLLRQLEDPTSRCAGYGFRIRNNVRLWEIGWEALDSCDDWSKTERVHELIYQAESWPAPRRVVMVEQPGELLPHLFFLLTSFSIDQMSGPALLAWYRRRGIAEGHLGELKTTLRPRLSCTIRDRLIETARGLVRAPGDRDGDVVRGCNEVTLVLNCLAYNLMNAARRLADVALPNPSRKRLDDTAGTTPGWSLQRLREQLLKVACRVTQHARQIHVFIPTVALAMWMALLAAIPVGTTDEHPCAATG